MEHRDTSFQRPLFVELSGTGVHHIFELDSEERAFLVGSSRQADLRLDHPGIAAVEFHIERVSDVACLVPAYRGRRLRVNGAPATSSVPLIGRALVALGALELELKVLHHQDEASTTNGSSSAPRPLPLDYAATVPTDTAPTAVAMKPFVPDPLANFPTQQLAVQRMFPLSHQQTERIAPVRPLPLQFAQLTERLPPLTAQPPHSRVPPLQAQHTQRLAPVPSPVLAPPPAVLPIPVLAIRAVGAEPPRATAQNSAPTPLATQETTSFDVAAVAAPPPAMPPVEAPRAAPRPATPKARAGGVARMRSPQRAVFGAFLIQLGALTKQRPVLVLGGALMGALLLALALVGATRVTEPKRIPAPASRPTASASVAEAKPTVSATSGPPVTPAPTAIAVALPAESKPSPRTAKGPHDPEVAVAVGHLAAGRIAEASKAYGALALRPTGGEVYAKAAALLARRAGTCSGGSTAPCPEVLK